MKKHEKKTRKQTNERLEKMNGYHTYINIVEFHMVATKQIIESCRDTPHRFRFPSAIGSDHQRWCVLCGRVDVFKGLKQYERQTIGNVCSIR